MDCREFNLILAEVLVRAQLPAAARQHLDECAACAAMVNDFEDIAERVKGLAGAESAAVPDLWPQIRETLLREGIIHSEGPAPAGRPQPHLVKPDK